MFRKYLRPAATTIVALTVVTGFLYPLLVTVVAQYLFPGKANGSLIQRDGQSVGSALIGQPFTRLGYFWGRPSATAPFAYNAAASSGSNYGTLHPALLASIQKRINELKQADPSNSSPIPIDLVTASGSGLDPHISVSAALYQIPRVGRARGMSELQVRALVDENSEGRQLGFFGEPRVNVLKLNLALDALKSSEIK